MKPSAKTFYEFFSGGGMARAGLGNGWQCLFANDICEKKATCAGWAAKSASAFHPSVCVAGVA